MNASAVSARNVLTEVSHLHKMTIANERGHNLLKHAGIVVPLGDCGEFHGR